MTVLDSFILGNVFQFRKQKKRSSWASISRWVEDVGSSANISKTYNKAQIFCTTVCIPRALHMKAINKDISDP